MFAFALLPLFALSAAAIQVTTPSNTTGWTTSGPQTIEWTSVSTDASNFTIQLINPASPNSPTTLAQNVMTSDAEYTYTPSSDLAPGNQWRVNIISSTNQAGILAQSEYFEVKQGNAVASSASASASASSSGVAPSVMSAASSVTGTQSQSVPSAASSAAAAASSKAAADRTIAGVSGVGMVAVAMLSYFA